MKLFSIITVCLNAEKTIEDTILSVLGQDCNNYEYLVKDGCSIDNTVKIAESYKSAFAKKGISFSVVSESDHGIYDAMNKALDYVQGEWVLYLNAGDRLVNRFTLSEVLSEADFSNSDIIYGDTICRDSMYYLYKKADAIDDIRFKMPFCHQSVFTKKKLFENSLYSLEYRICSDYRFYLQQFNRGAKFCYIPIAISIYDVHGISSNLKALNREVMEILREMPVRDEFAIRIREKRDKTNERKNERRLFIFNHFWRFVPKKIRQIRRSILKKKAGWKTEEEFFAQYR